MFDDNWRDQTDDEDAVHFESDDEDEKAVLEAEEASDCDFNSEDEDDESYSPCSRNSRESHSVRAGSIIFDFAMLLPMLSIFVKCPNCHTPLQLYELTKCRRGLFAKFFFMCENCKFQSEDFRNSTVNQDGIEEVNLRWVIRQF